MTPTSRTWRASAPTARPSPRVLRPDRMSGSASLRQASRHPAVDVCVVGSGAAGLPVATRLAQHGFRVVILERGPWMRRAAFLEDELLIRRGLFWPTVDEEPRTWRPN